MKVTRVAHVSVNVEAHLDDTRAFYRDVLGLGDVPRPDIARVAGHWHSLGGAELHLVDAPHAGHGIDPTGPHFCVFVEDLDAAIRELDARGIEQYRTAQGTVAQIFIVDPAGNTIELQQERG